MIVSTLAQKRGVTEAFKHYRSLYNKTNAYKVCSVEALEVPTGQFDPMEDKTFEEPGDQRTYHRMIIDDPWAMYWCMTWEDTPYGIENEEIVPTYLERSHWINDDTKDEIVLGPCMMRTNRYRSILPMKEEYGCTCVVCKEHNEYAIKRNNHTCYSCRSYQVMFSGSLNSHHTQGEEQGMAHKYSIAHCKTKLDEVQYFFHMTASFENWARKANKSKEDIDSLTEEGAIELLKRFRARTDYAIDKNNQWYHFNEEDAWVKIPTPNDIVGIEPHVWEDFHFNR